MSTNFIATALALLASVGMWAFFELGHALGRRHAEIGKGASTSGLVQGGVAALLGLLVSFSFSGAWGRFDAHRHLVVEEANAIDTAYLRLDLLSQAGQVRLRTLFRRYADARLERYKVGSDAVAVDDAQSRSHDLQMRIWSEAIAGLKEQNTAATTVLLPALNRMIDVATEQAAIYKSHPPWIIFAMLAAVAWATAGLAGEAMAHTQRSSRIQLLIYAAILGLVVFVVGELELPRTGLIRIEAFDQMLVDVRRSMGPD